MSTTLQQQSTTVAIASATARNGSDLAVGEYQITADVDCFVRQGGSGVVATTSSVPLWSKGYIKIRVTGTGDARIAVIRASSDGTLYIVPVA